MPSISGFKSGRLEKRKDYRYFVPELVNQEWNLDSKELVYLNEQASRLLGELNGFSQLIPDVDFFTMMHILKEAQTSSKIEGTKTNMEEALLSKADIDPEKRDDWSEVQNYIQAMNQAIKGLQELPLSSRLIKNTHKTLLQGVRGKHKMPGEYRTSQNWIGGANLTDATFIPPAPDYLNDLMGDWENFVHNEYLYIPHLLKIGIAHYQFETIHPFLDGNGRIGRLIITLYLVSKNLLTYPTLYVSDFFERNRELYYRNLNNVRTENNMEQWLKFFLTGIVETSENSIQVFRKIIDLRRKIDTEITPSFGRRFEHVKKLINQLFQKPLIQINEVEKLLSVSTPTASKLVHDMEKKGVLKEITGFERNKIFVFEEYLDLFR